MDEQLARRRFAAAPVARLGTVTPGGRPHLVPCCFALEGDTVYTVVDAKPKTTAALRRVRNIAANPAVSLLVDHYENDWTALWWIRLDGTARVADEPSTAATARRLLAGKYPQYRRVEMPGPVIAIGVEGWVAWP